MAGALYFQETVTQDLESAFSSRLGAGAATASDKSNNLTSADVGKPVKLVGESRYDLAASGNALEGVIIALETATQGGFSTGTIVNEGLRSVTFDGSEAAGTGALAVGDYVVVGTNAAKGVAQSGPMRVRKATQQPGQAPADLTAAGVMLRNTLFAWRVVSLGPVGTGAVGTTGLIERVTC